jgi:L-ascorbate metabolism protein UlaG (beta-lactamase superfamily)
MEHYNRGVNMASTGSISEGLRQLYESRLNQGELSILYLGYSGVVLRTQSKVFAFDPANLIGQKEVGQLKKLDAIFYSHGHGDHFSKDHAILLSSKTGAYVVAEASLTSSLKGAISNDKLVMAKAGEKREFDGFKLTSIEGIHRGPIILFLVEAEGISTFHGGDSAYVQLGKFKADIALVPTGSPSPTASPRDAFRMILDLKPKVALAFHGSTTQHSEFVSLVEKDLSHVKATILEEGKVIKVSVK